jgi:cell division protein FtsB
MSASRPVGATAPFRSLLGVVAVALLIPLGIAGIRTFRDLSVARARQALLEEKLRQAEEELGRLEDRVADLRESPATIERLAREHLGWVRPGEVIVYLPPERAAAATAVPTAPTGSRASTTPAPTD